MSEEGGPYIIDVQGAKYADWERSKIVLTDGKGNEKGAVVAPDYPGVLEFVARGGEIEPRGTPAEELAHWKRRKIEEIERCSDQRLEKHEPNYSRRARLARIVLASVCPSTASVDVDATRFDAETLACAVNYIRHVLVMRTVEAVNAFDPFAMAWPKHT